MNLDTPRGPILYLSGVTVSFDGFRALDSLSLIVEPGELRCIIGPNGAGKTTLMDVITGKTRPDSGEVFFGEKSDLATLSEPEIARRGIGRKFQKPTVFRNHTVFENLELALEGDKGVLPTLRARRTPAQDARIDEVLALIGLSGKTELRADLLSHGEKQWLEMGMLLVQDPRLLLLDEPVAGMTDEETARTGELFRSLAGRHGHSTTTLVVVEHDMRFVESIAEKVTVLHEGRVLVEGTMDTVRDDPRVVEVYLGR
jgi:urea transport system ATP-binding protein